MTPEQLEEIRVSAKDVGTYKRCGAHYFGHFEEGEEGHVPETAEGAEAAEGEETGELETENAPAVEGDAEAES